MIIKTMTFGGKQVIIRETISKDGDFIIECPEHSTRVIASAVKYFWRERTRIMVGFNHSKGECVEMWEDESYINIGCLREPKEEFKKKYIELIKYLNKQDGNKVGENS